MKKVRITFILVLNYGLVSLLIAQSPNLPFSIDAGLPLIRNYSPREYQAAADVWAIAQDYRGVMYFGCGSGVLEYDGVTWRLIQMTSGSTVFVLAEANDGRIYAGGKGDLGYLAPDSIGQMQFISLLEKIDTPYRKFNEINSIAITEEGVLFQCFERLFLYTDNTIKVWQPKTSFGYVNQVGNSVYIRQNSLGLMQMRGDSLYFIPGGKILANEVIIGIAPYTQSDSLEKLLIVSFNKGLLLFDHLSLRPVMPEVTALLESNIYRITICPGKKPYYALASLGNGLVIVNQDGHTLKHLNKNTGLISNKIHALYFDHQNALWLASANGIARIELFSPISIYDVRLGFPSSVKRIFRYEGALYVLNQAGDLFTLSGRSHKDHRVGFQRISDISAKWDLIPFDDSWLTYDYRTILQVQNGKSYRVCKGRLTQINTFHRSVVDSNRVYVGDLIGLFSIRRIPGINGSDKWINEGEIVGVQESITRIIESDNGDLWLETDGSYPVRLKFSQILPAESGPHTQRKPNVERYGAWHGLPHGKIYIFPTATNPVFVTEKGLFRFIEKTHRFVSDSTYGSHFADGTLVVDLLVEDKNTNTWIATSEVYESVLHFVRSQTDSRYKLVRSPLLNVSVGKVTAIYPENNGITWFGGTEGLVRYDSNIQQTLDFDFPILIRKVLVNGDSIIFGGTSALNLSTSKQFDEILPVALMYSENTLRFEFAAPWYNDEGANRFKYFLEGFEEHWSDWTYETQKDYTNLPPGNYRFRVRARNVYEHLGSESFYSFRIMPPWWHTWWAYTLYAIIILSILYAIRQYEMNRIRLKNQLKIEHIEREKLKEVDRMKSQFFANISHEFRTPLTLILGPVDKMISKITDRKDKQDLNMIQRNAKHLLQLINQLLDLSKLESGKMQLQVKKLDLIQVLRSVTMSFQSIAEQKKILLLFDSPESALEVSVDQEKLEKIFFNLLSNALKFTPEGGKVSMNVERISGLAFSSTKGEEFVEIRVKDTGIGIVKEEQTNVFKRFYQVENTNSGEFEGTGIGLALVKELVELHHGMIKMNSEQGLGTEVVVHLPLGRAHLTEEEIEPETKSLQGKQGQVAEMDFQFDELKSFKTITKTKLIDDPQEITETPIVLIVEDNADLRSYVHQYLVEDYNLFEAENGQEGLEKAIDLIPDLVISDIMMPLMDGYALCENLKKDEKTSHIPVILLTAKASHEEKLVGLETGADDYLTKPFDARELLVRVKNLIELRRKLREKFSTESLLEQGRTGYNSMDDAFLKHTVSIVEKNLEDESFNVEALAGKLHMSRSQLHRKITALTNQPVVQFIRTFRLKFAEILLREGELNITEVAYRTGFGSHAYFTKVFREHYGVTPKDFKASL